MPKLLLPDARFRSPTAVDGKADMRDENVYSAVVVAHGGAGQIKVFTVPQGQAIPRLGTTGAVAAHQSIFTELTTNLTKAGELGSSIGDASIRAIGITFENAAYDASGVPRTFGATQFEVNDLLSKTFFQLKIAGKLQIQGATHMFPAAGGAFGSVSTTESTVTVSQLTNGWPGTLRRLKLPILAARTDTLEGVYGVAGGATLAFSDATTGQNSLVWFVLHALVVNCKQIISDLFAPLTSNQPAFAV